MVDISGAGDQPTSDLLWSEPVDLRLLLSQTKYIWSLAADDGDIHSATYYIVAQ